MKEVFLGLFITLFIIGGIEYLVYFVFEISMLYGFLTFFILFFLMYSFIDDEWHDILNFIYNLIKAFFTTLPFFSLPAMFIKWLMGVVG